MLSLLVLVPVFVVMVSVMVVLLAHCLDGLSSDNVYKLQDIYIYKERERELAKESFFFQK